MGYKFEPGLAQILSLNDYNFEILITYNYKIFISGRTNTNQKN